MKFKITAIAAIIFSTMFCNIIYADNYDDTLTSIIKSNHKYVNNQNDYMTRVEALNIVTDPSQIGIKYYYNNKDYVSDDIYKTSELEEVTQYNGGIDVVYNGLKLDIINTGENNIFNPYNLITKEDLYVMLYNIIKSDKIDLYSYNDISADISVLNKYSDKDEISEYAKIPIAFFISHKVISKENIVFNPKGYLKIEEVFAIRDNVLNNFKRENSNNYITRIDTISKLNNVSFSGIPQVVNIYYFGEPVFCDMDYRQNIDFWGKWNAVDWATQNNIVLGYADNSFKPESFITREDLCVILYRIITSEKSTTFNLSNDDLRCENNILTKYKDAYLVSEYAKKSVEFFISKNILQINNTSINPKGYITIDEFEDMISKIAGNFMIDEKYDRFLNTL